MCSKSKMKRLNKGKHEYVLFRVQITILNLRNHMRSMCLSSCAIAWTKYFTTDSSFGASLPWMYRWMLIYCLENVSGFGECTLSFKCPNRNKKFLRLRLGRQAGQLMHIFVRFRYPRTISRCWKCSGCRASTSKGAFKCRH